MTLVRGDALYLLDHIAPGTAQCCVTSPPYLRQRVYGDDPREGGTEDTLTAYVIWVADCFDRIRTALTPDGLAWLNIGDKANGCVDEATEILTDHGWKRYDELVAGDAVLTLNADTWLAEWGTATAVNIFPPALRKLLEVGGRGHTSLTTSNHRWYTERRTGRGPTRRYVREVVTSDELTSEHRIPTSARVANLPAEARWADALVEAVAWYFTEGSDREHGGIYIGQSHTANPAHVASIRGCLTRLLGPPLSRLPGRAGDGPAWCEYRRPDDVAEFRLNVAAGALLREHAPDKVPSAQWLATLTQHQLDLFIATSIAGDGHQRAGKDAAFSQVDRRRAEAFQIACILSGRAASLSVQTEGLSPGLNARPGAVAKPRWIVQIRSNTMLKPLRHPHRWVEHHGIVWCPTTTNGTWLARRNGQVFFTGNSGGAGGDWNPARKRAAPGGGPGKFTDPAYADQSYLDVPGAVVAELLRRGWRLRLPIVWNKDRQAPEDLVHVGRPRWQHEMIYLLAPGPDRPRFYPSALVEQGSIWTFPPGGNGDAHLAPFPDELPRRCILASTAPGDLVIDPFAGSGTTLRVAEELGRRALGIDLYAPGCDNGRENFRADVTPSDPVAKPEHLTSLRLAELGLRTAVYFHGRKLLEDGFALDAVARLAPQPGEPPLTDDQVAYIAATITHTAQLEELDAG